MVILRVFCHFHGICYIAYNSSTKSKLNSFNSLYNDNPYPLLRYILYNTELLIHVQVDPYSITQDCLTVIQYRNVILVLNQNNKILELSKFKAVADDEFKIAKMIQFSRYRPEK